MTCATFAYPYSQEKQDAQTTLIYQFPARPIIAFSSGKRSWASSLRDIIPNELVCTHESYYQNQLYSGGIFVIGLLSRKKYIFYLGLRGQPNNQKCQMIQVVSFSDVTRHSTHDLSECINSDFLRHSATTSTSPATFGPASASSRSTTAATTATARSISGFFLELVISVNIRRYCGSA